MRAVLGTIVGVVAAFVCMMIAEGINHALYPIPSGVDPRDTAAIKRLVATLPPGAFVMVLAGWLIGTLLGTYLAAKIGRSRVPAYIVGVILLCLGIVNSIIIPQPLWFDALACLIFLAAPFAGIAMAKPVQSAPA
jgi:hypothetical protein